MEIHYTSLFPVWQAPVHRNILCCILVVVIQSFIVPSGIFRSSCHYSLPSRQNCLTLGSFYSIRREWIPRFARDRYKVEQNYHCSELRSCVKVEVAVLGSLSLIVLMVSVDEKQDLKKKTKVAPYQRLGAV